MTEPRAIVFDLDDTLYPYRSFVVSGLAVVADAVAVETGLTRDEVSDHLRDARRFQPGRELQYLRDRLNLPVGSVDRWVDLVRGHQPDIRLPLESSSVLKVLRSTWRVGVLTNGSPEIQRRKVTALGVRDLVDAVVFATECGDGRGKPDRAAFDAVLRELDVPARRAVFVGDDLDADIAGAANAGMRTIHVLRDVQAALDRPWIRPDARVPRISSVPRAADRLMEGEFRANVA